MVRRGPVGTKMTGSVCFACFYGVYFVVCIAAFACNNVDHHVLALRVARTLHAVSIVAHMSVVVHFGVFWFCHAGTVAYIKTVVFCTFVLVVVVANAPRVPWVKALTTRTLRCLLLVMPALLLTSPWYLLMSQMMSVRTLSPMRACFGRTSSNNEMSKRESATL